MNRNLDCWTVRELLRLLLCCTDEKPRLHVTAKFGGLSFTVDGDFKMSIKDTEVPGTLTLSIDPTEIRDSKGKPARLDGPPVWSVQADQDNVTLVSQAPDGLSAQFHVTDNIAATQAMVNADANLDPGAVTTLTGTYVIEVVPGDAVSLGPITAGTIVPDATP